MDVDAEMPEYRALASYYADQGGALWSAEADGQIAGMIATRPLTDRTWEICRVYVDPGLHGSGLAHALLDHAEHHAIAAGADRLVLWSDTRFDRAHRFYEKRSYLRHGPVRVLHDISNSLEFGYAKPVNGTACLDIAAAESAVGRLAAILVSCVDAGGSIAFLRPLAPDKARAFWQRAALQVGVGDRIIVAAWRNGILTGAGTLDLAMPETQPHCTDLQAILVDPPARRRGLGQQILHALEGAAISQRRSLLTAKARAATPGEMLYRTHFWQETGRVPGFTRDADGTMHTTIFFWKRIEGCSGGRPRIYDGGGG